MSQRSRIANAEDLVVSHLVKRVKTLLDEVFVVIEREYSENEIREIHNSFEWYINMDTDRINSNTIISQSLWSKLDASLQNKLIVAVQALLNYDEDLSHWLDWMGGPEHKVGI